MKSKNLLALVLALVVGACTTTNGNETVSYQYRHLNPDAFNPVVIIPPEVSPAPSPSLAPSPTSTPLAVKVIPTPKPKPRPKIAKVKISYLYYKTVYGIASNYGPGYAGYLALPQGRGILVEVCGPARCIIKRSNDAGPSKAGQRAGRVVDLDVATFQAVCGCSWTKGLIHVRVRYMRG
jgi:hypothetical protein